MIIVSDTTAITTLLKAGMDGLLSKLFEEIIVPPAVSGELTAFHSKLPNFILVRSIARSEHPPQIESLGRGESEAITLAMEINADLILMDDLKARSIATSLNLRCMGLLGIIILGKQRGHIGSVREAVEALESRGGLYLSDSVKLEALKLAKETE